MAVKINIPKLGMTMREADLVKWKFKEGDQIKTGDIVLVIETDKVTYEIEATASGYLHIVVGEGARAPVGAVAGLIAETKEELENLQKDAGEAAVAVAKPETAEAPEAAIPAAAKPGKGEKIKVSPLARKLAEENNIDLSTLTGTGPGGRITKQDLINAIEAQNAARSSVPSAETAATPERDGKKIKRLIPLKGMRKAIAEHMHRSLSVSAQMTITADMNAMLLKKTREDLVAQEEIFGVRITYADIFVLAIAKTLEDVPTVNASLIDNEIILWEDINIGVAVALEGADVTGFGLIVPVIKNANRKSLTEISRELKDKTQRAREGKLALSDISGGTFTLTNMGAVGGAIRYGTPIINQPESAILATMPISDQVVVENGEIVIRPILPLSLTLDHRVVDGALANKFLGKVIKYLSNLVLLLR